ncbi:hypothetical protein KXQ82_11995 [Mucilaginibacter sp. HMF5004]|uniref:DUF922 domain-containing protein n=1 Tax=Mucilaginibacter rivuli TaxID=2857527 RepID=UPI001C604A23|nr:hypothetical protein [Mucilaginibacter rivuli]MBW4890447.1 hypothetical protein [Mucilaginibacter rivuli]
MMRRIAVIMFLFIPIFTHGQSYHRLTARDFYAAPSSPQSGDIAFTSCQVNYTYQVIHNKNNYDITFDVKLSMDNARSYIRMADVSDREQLQQILRHEQGHYNIAFLLKCEAYTVLSRYHYSANYQREIDYLYRQLETKYKKMNADYEASTEHMQNNDNQEKWNAWFSRRIDNVSLASAN